MTVPILIALGVSVMKAQRQKQQALAVVEDAAVNRSEGERVPPTLLGTASICMHGLRAAAASTSWLKQHT